MSSFGAHAGAVLLLCSEIPEDDFDTIPLLFGHVDPTGRETSSPYLSGTLIFYQIVFLLRDLRPLVSVYLSGSGPR